MINTPMINTDARGMAKGFHVDLHGITRGWNGEKKKKSLATIATNGSVRGWTVLASIGGPVDELLT